MESHRVTAEADCLSCGRTDLPAPPSSQAERNTCTRPDAGGPAKRGKATTQLGDGGDFAQIGGHVLLDQASGRLLAVGRPIALIARSIGYTSESAFTHAFKRATGLSPKAYRARPPGDSLAKRVSEPRTTVNVLSAVAE